MQKRLIFALTAVVLGALIFFIARTPRASAHEGRTIGEYNIEFGWRVEPAFVGISNGPELLVSAKGNEEQKIERLERTLKLTVSFGNASRTLKLKEVYQDPGHYVVDMVPTRPGDYIFHLTGNIKGTAVDETFTSADGDFSSIEPASDVLFPDTKLDLASLQTQIDALKAEVEKLKAVKK